MLFIIPFLQHTEFDEPEKEKKKKTKGKSSTISIQKPAEVTILCRNFARSNHRSYTIGKKISILVPNQIYGLDQYHGYKM